MRSARITAKVSKKNRLFIEEGEREEERRRGKGWSIGELCQLSEWLKRAKR
jgi:hypothetical protein